MNKTPEPYKPDFLLDIIKIEVINHLLLGFQESLEMDVAIIFKEKDDLRYIKPHNSDRHIVDSCCFFRDNLSLDCDDICVKAEIRKAEELINNKSAKGEIYECSSLGLKNMAYPIHIYGKTLGVILTGQKWLKGSTKSKEVYNRAKSYCSERLENSEVVSKFLDILKESEKESISQEELDEYFTKLCNFGDLITSIILTISYKEEKIRQNEFLDWIEQLLSKVPSDGVIWQGSIKLALDKLKYYSQGEIQNILFFTGKSQDNGVKYMLYAMNDNKWIEPQSIKLSMQSESEEIYHFANLPDAFQQAFKSIDIEKSIYYFHYFNKSSHRNLEDYIALTVIQSKKNFEKNTQEFYKDFSERICRADSFVRLFLKQLIAHQNYENNIIDLRHDLKTSLQHVQGNMDMLFLQYKNRVLAKGDIILDNAIKETRTSLRDISLKVQQFDSNSLSIEIDPIKRIDLYQKIFERFSLYTHFASKKDIQLIVPTGSYPTPEATAHIYCSENVINRAIDALIDNAIKYSYFKKRIYLTGELNSQRARFSLKNYGVGIPAEKISSITERYARAEVKDYVSIRRGSGLGLSIASQVFLNLLKGEIRIVSEPTHKTNKTIDHHEYITIVTVDLPLS